MKKPPHTFQAPGADGEQLSFLPSLPFCPTLPPAHSAAAKALDDLLQGDLTQLDWLATGNGWRLAAAVKELDYLGWEPKSIRVKCNGWGKQIARYSLPEKSKQVASAMRQQRGRP
jgi:hypothetical protein